MLDTIQRLIKTHGLADERFNTIFLHPDLYRKFHRELKEQVDDNHVYIPENTVLPCCMFNKYLILSSPVLPPMTYMVVFLSPEDMQIQKESLGWR